MSYNGKILYIEDDTDLANQVAEKLIQQNYFVDIAENGKNGLSMYAEKAYDILIIDYHIPLIDGLQVIETLVNKNINIPFIMVTGRGSEQLAVRVMKLGASDYIIKNDNYINKLIHAISRTLEKTKSDKNKDSILLEGKRRFNHIFSYTNFPLAMVEIESGLFLHASETFCDMIGYSQAELANMTVFDIIYPADKALSLELQQDILTEKKTSFKIEKRYIHKNGQIVWVILSVLFVKRFKDKSLYCVAHFEDISLLRRTQALLDATLDAASEGIVVFSEKGKIIYSNQQFLSMWHLPQSALNEWENDEIIEFISEQLKDSTLIKKIQSVEIQSTRKCELLERKDGRFYECVECPPKPRILCDQVVGRVSSVRDITRQKHAEIAQQRMLHFLETVVNNIPSPIFYKNQEGEFLGYNRAFVQAFFGESQEKLESQPEPLSSEQHRYREARILEKGETQIYEAREEYADGSIQNLIFHTAPFNIGNGKRGIIGAITEITKRKKAEELLRLSEERYALAQRAANIGSWDWDILSHKIHWSEQVEPMLGFDFGEFGKTYEDFLNCIHPWERRIFEKLIREKIQKGQGDNFEMEFRVVWKDHTVHWVSVVGDVIRSTAGEAIRMIGVIRDITEQKQVEEKLRIAEIVFDNSSEAITVTSASNKIIAVNPAYSTITGYTKKEVIGKNPNILKSGRHDEAFYKKMWSDIKEKKRWHGEIWNKRKNGEIYPELLTVTKVKKVIGQQAHYIAMFQDILDIKETEEQLKVAKESAESASRAKSEFLSNMSHEIRTPLNGILGFAQILEADSTLTPEQLDGIQTIKKSGEHLLTLINDILDLSKIEAGKMELYEKEFEFQEFIKNLIDIVQVRTKQAKISFHYKKLSPLPDMVRGDETRLRQVLINLLGNAVKFTKKGEVNFSVGYHRDKIRFEVHDTGTGIATEQLQDIFEPFQQVGKKQYMIEGTGLGLPISRKFITMMGGQLHVESTLGEGSTFWFELTLPVAQGHKKLEESQFKVIGFTGKSRKILIVDDEFINRALLNRLLSSVGFNLIEAENGKQGVQSAIDHRPDVILMDLLMPVMDGFEAIHNIRQVPELKDTMIIVVSASVFEEHRQKSLEVGCNDFVSKPVNLQELLRKIGDYLKLQWIYDTTTADIISEHPTTINSTKNNHFDGLKMAIPSKEVLENFYNLSLIGDVESLIEQATALKKQDKFTHFAVEIKTMAEEFQIREIREWIESLK